MTLSLWIGLREGLQCALLLALLIEYPGVRERSLTLLAGVITAFIAGAPLSYLPGLGALMPETAFFQSLRYLSECLILYSSVVLLALIRQDSLGRLPRVSTPLSLFALGFLLFFFESRSAGLAVHDAGLMQEAVLESTALGLAGAVLGFLPLPFIKPYVARLRPERALTLPALLVTLGVFKFVMGGVGEIEDGNLLVALQCGIQGFTEGLVGQLQNSLMLTGHEFLEVPLSGLASYLAGDRMSTSIMVVFVTVPPVLALVDVFSRPDPDLRDLRVAAERRLRKAYFRKEMIIKASPVIFSFVLILVALHAVNVSLNPLSEPAPFPVRESTEMEGKIVIPLNDRLGNFTDGKLRKYLYHHGKNRIVFIGILKPDGTVGLALDECEICKPADWNTSAVGYAQRGEHLVCKYCMTPIPIPTVNKPGGCNPIPVSFSMEDDAIVVEIEELVRVFKAARDLEKKGTHL